MSSIDIATSNPLNNPQSGYAKAEHIFDFVMTIIFTIEIVIKVIANGFIACGRKSYIRNPENILDFVIVVFCLALLFLPDSNDASFIKIFRLVRLFRPLRLITRNKGLLLAIKAIGLATPKIFN